jgi:hypothetical protein
MPGEGSAVVSCRRYAEDRLPDPVSDVDLDEPVAEVHVVPGGG